MSIFLVCKMGYTCSTTQTCYYSSIGLFVNLFVCHRACYCFSNISRVWMSFCRVNDSPSELIARYMAVSSAKSLLWTWPGQVRHLYMLLTMVRKRKLKWYGHISRSSGMAKTILQGTVKWTRRRGRQKKRWYDSIKELTGMQFGDFPWAAKDRKGWTVIVATSLVVLQLPPAVK